MRRLILLAVVWMILFSAAAPGRCAAATAASPAQRAAVAAELARLQESVNSRNLDRVLACYGPEEELRKEVRARVRNALGLDSLACRERLGGVVMHGDTAEAAVREELTWREHGRTQVDCGWRTRRYELQGGRWIVIADRERDDAHTRYTDLTLDVDTANGSLTGSARLTIGLGAGGEDDVLLGLNRGLAVDAVEAADGKPAAFTRVADLVSIPVAGLAGPGAAAGAGSPDSVTLLLRFHGAFFNESAEQGYSQVGIGPRAAFASWVTEWYPRVSGTGSKSRGRITYVVPESMLVASSGRRISTTVANGRSTQVFQVDAPLDFSFAAARYFHKQRIVDGIDVGVFFLQGGDRKADLYIAECAKVLAFQRGYYGFYPFDSYAVVELPAEAIGTLGGSSEQGMNLFPAGGLPDDEFPLALLAHEIGHSWWGNLVRSGGSSILDEGLAQMSAAITVDSLAGPRVMRRFLTRGLAGYSQSARDYFSRFAGDRELDLPLNGSAAGSDQAMATHDIADDKGFFVYEMLRETIGPGAFRRGLRRTLANHAGGTLHLADLRAAWELESRTPLGWFFDQWFGRSGAPGFRMAYDVTPAPRGGFVVSGTVTQEGEPYRVRAEIALAREGVAPRIEILPVSERVTRFRYASAARPDTVLFDPDYKILRWTDDYRNGALLKRARLLRSRGVADSARVALREFLTQAPASIAGHSFAGTWALEDGALDEAGSEFRWVFDRTRSYEPDDPAVTRSLLGMGKVADLHGHREEAVGWYRRAVARPDDDGMSAEAARLLESPFRLRAPADPALLARCVGTYAADPSPIVSVALGPSGVLTASTAGTPPFGLEWSDASTFRVAGNASVVLRFTGGDGPFAELALETPARVFHLKRTGP